MTTPSRITHEVTDDHWRLGMLYSNPADERFIVPKRPAWMGWTINLAHPAGRVVTGIVVGLVGMRIVRRIIG